jgi:ectoine hydroxylase-related dioxygenase (phytanoyl-CoA dioxygenase family)
MDELEPPPDAAIATGRSRRAAAEFDRGAFWQSVSTGKRLRALSHGAALRAITQEVLDAEPRGHDFLYLRAAPPGRATGIHYDYPFFGLASDKVVTAWIPIGDVPAREGPLVIVEGSNRFDDLIAAMRTLDIAGRPEKKAAYDSSAVALAQSRGTRLLTADFRAGDVVLFGMYTAHGSLDNHSPARRVRLSLDIRYQPADEPRDERYFGPNPGGTTGAGYAELNGARPLTEEWHVR